ncbi:MAG: 2,3,4,5-tetrahydropyridine-2,6-dicarboxylate N-succinyltransferase [Candidatus Limnocylindrales bacterium]
MTTEPTARHGSLGADSRASTDPSPLAGHIEAADAAWAAAAGAPSDGLVAEVRALVAELVAALEAGEVRAATPDPTVEGGWRVDPWVKTAILLGFRLPGMTDLRDGPILAARDKAAYGLLDLLGSRAAEAAQAAGAPWRVVPGGSAVRSGVHLEPGVTIMPPSYANIGAWVGRGSMIDSHVLVGSCAQVGEGVHLSAAVQIGGVLEPAGARPVIVEDGAFVGGQAGLYEGVTVSRGAVIGAGTIITGQSRLIDLVHERELRGTPATPLVVPAGAVVVPGTRPAGPAWAADQGLSVSVPLIIKYRDAGTDARVALEDALR